MSRITHPLNISSPLARTLAVAALMGTTFLVSPLTAAYANSAGSPPVQLAQNAPARTVAATQATSDKGETVEQRITNLHVALKIVPEEEAKWNAVAQAMRENAANMDKLVATKRTQAPQGMTALDDLKTYQDFGQAHLDGLKNLTSAFTTLYDAMTDAQKKNADQVFQNFGHGAAPAHG